MNIEIAIDLNLVCRGSVFPEGEHWQISIAGLLTLPQCFIDHSNPLERFDGGKLITHNSNTNATSKIGCF